jgi:transcriptional regulator with XRE-family HTH domain
MKNNIREIRQKRGLTLTELAKKLSMSKGNLSQMETGKLGLTQENIDKMTSILKVSSSELLGEKMVTEKELINIRYVDNILSIKSKEELESVDTFVFDEKFLFFLGVGDVLKNILIIKAVNNSMYPNIENGDIIFINRSENSIIRNGFYLLLEQGIMQIRQVIIDKENKKIKTSAINKDSFGNLENVYRQNELADTVCGRVIFCIKKFF